MGSFYWKSEVMSGKAVEDRGSMKASAAEEPTIQSLKINSKSISRMASKIPSGNSKPTLGMVMRSACHIMFWVSEDLVRQ